MGNLVTAKQNAVQQFKAIVDGNYTQQQLKQVLGKNSGTFTTSLMEVYTNEFIEMLGCSDLRDFMSFTGASFANVVHPDDKARVFEQLSAVADRGEDDTKCSASFRIVTKSGTPLRVTNHSRFVEISDIGDVFYSFIVEG